MLLGEILLFFVLLGVSVWLGWVIWGSLSSKSLKGILKNQAVKMCVFTVLVLLSVFFLIHLLFCYQIGFPASKTQNNSDHLILTASDWLGFLSGYLGFAGSLLMSIVVYIQSRDINKLTLAEYKLAIDVQIKNWALSADYDSFKPNEFLQSPPNTEEVYYSYICKKVEGEIEDKSSFVLLFVEISNNSKSTIDKVSFQSIEIRELSLQQRYFKFINCGGDLDPADGRTTILPGRTIRRCFVVEDFPKSINKAGWIQFNFKCGNEQLVNQSLFDSVLVRIENSEFVLLD